MAPESTRDVSREPSASLDEAGGSGKAAKELATELARAQEENLKTQGMLADTEAALVDAKAALQRHSSAAAEQDAIISEWKVQAGKLRDETRQLERELAEAGARADQLQLQLDMAQVRMTLHVLQVATARKQKVHTTQPEPCLHCWRPRHT